MNNTQKKKKNYVKFEMILNKENKKTHERPRVSHMSLRYKCKVVVEQAQATDKECHRLLQSFR